MQFMKLFVVWFSHSPHSPPPPAEYCQVKYYAMKSYEGVEIHLQHS
jgi:hypothetical protein